MAAISDARLNAYVRYEPQQRERVEVRQQARQVREERPPAAHQVRQEPEVRRNEQDQPPREPVRAEPPQQATGNIINIVA